MFTTKNDTRDALSLAAQVWSELDADTLDGISQHNGHAGATDEVAAHVLAACEAMTAKCGSLAAFWEAYVTTNDGVPLYEVADVIARCIGMNYKPTTTGKRVAALVQIG